jgi:hypothetical protein
MSVNLPDDVAARLAAEAARRGLSVDDLAAELLAVRLLEPPEGRIEEDDALEAFIGCGASGRTEPFDLRQARRDLAEQKRAEGL